MKSPDKETIESLDPKMLDYPFVREGMTIDEYFEEKEYYFKQPMEEFKSQRYKPLWKQREEKSPK